MLGHELDGGWKVIQKVVKPKAATGGCFSQGYIVESAMGMTGFLKALDFTGALSHLRDPASAFLVSVQLFNFERTICEACKSHDRIVTAISSGAKQLNPADLASVVQYLIFELADGDVRSHLDSMTEYESAWALRALHHIAVGLQQLHSTDYSHQDLKPSNVMVFGKTDSKIGDLGRVVAKAITGPNDNFDIAGDRAYAPPELLYGYRHPDWSPRRLGCDAYHLGSMLCYFFTSITMTSLLYQQLPPEYNWQFWKGNYADVLPHVRQAFDEAVNIVSPHFPEPIRAELTATLQQLCDPDPALRGHPLNRGANLPQFGLERYVSLFNLLAGKESFRIKRKIA